MRNAKRIILAFIFAETLD